MTDLMQHLRDARPTDTELDAMWPAEQRADVLARVLDAPARSRTPRPRRRRVRAAALAVTATLAGLVIVPSTLSAASARSDLRALAVVALDGDAPVLTPGTFLHVTAESTQQDSPSSPVWVHHYDEWTDWDGTTWQLDTSVHSGTRQYNVYPPTPGSFYASDRAFIDSLPDTPDALRDFLDDRVSGSTSHDEAIFVAIADLARSHRMPPKTFAAALEVLAGVDGVRTEDITVNGRPAVRISHTRYFGLTRLWGGSSTDSLLIDRETAQVLSQEEGINYSRTTTSIDVVDEIPPAVMDVFTRYDVRPGYGRKVRSGQRPTG